MRFNSFKKQAELIQIRLAAIDAQVTTLSKVDPLGGQQIQKLKLLSETTTKKYNEFEKLVNKLFSTTPLPDDIEDKDVSALQETISDLFISISSNCGILIPNETIDESHSSNTTQHSPTGAPAVNVNLPRLSLPRFAGQPDRWITFHSLFENTIHKNESISSVEKFTYLLSCLSDEPLSLVKSLPVSPANYFIAWQTLTKRYHNSRLLITLHLTNLLDLSIPNNPSVKQLRQFVSSYNENSQALLALGHDVTKESLVLTTHLLRKFSSDIRSKFEHSRTDSNEMPTIKELTEFLEKECTQLEAASVSQVTQTFSRDFQSNKKPQATQNKQNYQKLPYSNKVALLTANKTQTCTYCSSADHLIYKCGDFSALDVPSRQTFVKEKDLCENCFGSHKIKFCRSNRNCITCNRRHHSMLHYNKNPVINATKNSSPSTYTAAPANALNASSPTASNPNDFVGILCNQNNTVLLATALVTVSNPQNENKIVVRAVLDSASQSTFITEHCANTLKLNRSSGPMINGVASSQVKTKGFTHVHLASLNGTLVASNQPVIILNQITNDLPKTKIIPTLKEKLKHFVLADPTFDTPAPIDLLIGADLFASCLNGSPHSLGDSMPSAINTVFGFVIIGTAPTITPRISDNHMITLLTVNELDLHSSIQRFWAIEEPPLSKQVSPEDQKCEEHFLNTHSRDETGRFICRLPFKSDPSVLGDVSKTAKSMLFSIERKFQNEPEFKNSYVEFMTDYIRSGHMKPCTLPNPLEKPCYVLPHHGVFKDGKIRVVFNASAHTANNISLNSILHQGPKLHNEINDIILKFRVHKFVFTCDIKQMFRQISIHADDQCYQLIYWRKDTSLPIQIFQLTTVTYGMSSSPYLANRVVQQLIADEGHNHPIAAQELRRQIFVDDALLGAETEDQALRLKEDVVQLLRKGGFELRKWASNSNKLLSLVPEDHQEKPLYFRTPEQPCFNVLGLKWIPKEDAFSYMINTPKGEITKRTVLSCIAKIYDPSGWLTPVIVWAKILMQLLWTLGITWDDPLPESVLTKWHQFTSQLTALEIIKIPRHLGILKQNNFQLHGFSDASESAYAACVYLRHDDQENVTVRLLIAKSRVSPLKRVTLPRLELCAALLLAKLLTYCSNQLSEYVSALSLHAWSDSTITLSWIHTPSYRLNVFVANRVAEIQNLTPPSIWSHVSSQHNPADCSSRGLLPQELITHPLWWEGPSWLKLPPQKWPSSTFKEIEESSLPDIKPQSVDILVNTEYDSINLLTKFSSWNKLLYVTAYIRRFITCLKTKQNIVGPLTLQEINAATNRICWMVQQESFREDITRLKSQKICSNRIQRLSPFLDDKGIIRVGGRLKNAIISHSARNPILLPKKHHVTDLIIDHCHKQNLHVGPQSLQAILAQQFWILSARNIIRQRIFKCIRCFKVKPNVEAPLMGDLPSGRVNPGRVFATSGTDFAGPFKIKMNTLRRVQTIKAYLCIFICFATKAVHLEVVTDLTSDAFIAALTRFVSRRGLVNHLYSDCGTNFVGAAATLQKLFRDLMKSPSLQHYALENKISFHFLPPHAPHQGGLWERAVRSTKHHLHRVVGDHILTYEEFVTLTARIEAMLNSRPITSLSADPNDLEPLTPGHFIAGGPLNTVLEPQLDLPTNRLRRWQIVQTFSQHLWQRWRKEYLHTLQQRSKWSIPGHNIAVGDLVVVHEPNTPPLYWKMGRVIAVSPGADGVVRVLQVKTASGTYSRPAVKVSRLPLA